MTLRHRLQDLGLDLPPPPEPHGEYVPIVVHAGIAYLSAQVSRTAGGTITGPISAVTPPEKVVQAARACVLRVLGALEASVGLDAVDRILTLRGFVHAEPGFTAYPGVLDEVSRLLIAVWGDRGRHARAVVGVAGLSDGGMLAVEVTAALKG